MKQCASWQQHNSQPQAASRSPYQRVEDGKTASLKENAGLQSKLIAYRSCCRTSYFSKHTHSVPTDIPFVLSLPALSLPKGRSTLLAKHEDGPHIRSC